MAYATLAQVKAFMGESNLGFNGDDLIEDLIDRAKTMIDAHCGGMPPRLRTFEADADSTRYYNALGDVIGATLYLHDDLAQTPTTVSNNGSTVSSGNYSLLSQYSPPRAPYNRIKLLSGTWDYTTNPERALAITGRFAYSVTAPLDITQACIRLVASVFRQRHSTSNIDRAVVSMDGTLILPDGLPKDVLLLLEPYVWTG